MNTSTLRAYHGDESIKAKYIQRIQAHRAAEHLMQGIGWEDEGGMVRGCAVGCTLETYDHDRYPVELGMPVWLARLEDAIFEGLPASDAQVWPEAFLEAIHPGADLEPVRHQLALLRMDRLIALQASNVGKHGEAIDVVIAQTIAAIQQVRRCHEAEIGGNVCDLPARSAAESAWSAARSSAESAARSAAESAESAAWSAAESAQSAARSAAESAWSAARSSAESAARSAAESAWSAARSAAESAESAAWSARSAQSWKQEASDLLKLLREAAP
jgi:hypothetical protein